MVKLPNNVDVNNLIDDLRILCWEAADILLYYSKTLKDDNLKSSIIKNKDSFDPVTLADLEVNDLILQKMQINYPDISWKYLSEENVKVDPYHYNVDSDWLWILDPLDGTRDFIQGTGEYAMHFALNYKNKPFLGFVLIPEKEELWISSGVDVWCEQRDRKKRKSSLQIKGSLSDMTLVRSKNHSNQMLTDLIEKINFGKVTVMGSIGCKIASIVRGESDIYISLSLPGKTSPKDWDFAAPEIILKTAGGAITNLDNKDLIYGQNRFEQGGIIVASNNKELHKNICLEIKEIILKNNLYQLND